MVTKIEHEWKGGRVYTLTLILSCIVQSELGRPRLDLPQVGFFKKTWNMGDEPMDSMKTK